LCVDFISCYIAKVFIRVRNFFGGVFRSSFPICILCISFSWFISVARNSRTILNNSVESQHPYLIPDFRVNGFSVSLLSMMLAIGLSYIAFIMLSYVPSILSFFRAFIMKECWILPKAFSASIEMIMWFLSLLLFICCITFIYLHMLNHSWILIIKPP
jgi:hypothetical protein